ncbi:S-adenosyl-L-methionine-dependent methyltransferase [Lipomyces arxii]|uniref:S-adenosyl-L-methionine-dependent methyltransferase n=1 Tax=Lipomyces arxii TaxID=56418 RepID=UPI0034CE3DD5
MNSRIRILQSIANRGRLVGRQGIHFGRKCRFNSSVSANAPIKPAAENKSLGEVLASAIRATGPISLAAYMRQCLTNPEAGYYINKDPFGAGGDFITSPEISQMFGELIGIWFITQWLALDKPEKVMLVELGPGRGTLMADMLRTFQSFEPFMHSVAGVCMVEASPTLRDMQHKLLCSEDIEKTETGYKSVTRAGIPIQWFENLKDVPRAFQLTPFFVAHEFFDALPVHQFEHTQDGWRELLVDYSIPKVNTTISLPSQTSSLNETPKFHLTVPTHATPGSQIMPNSSPRYSKLPVKSKIEISPVSWEFALDIANRICERDQQGKQIGVGAALIIDYGPADTIPVDSLRAIKKHHIVSPFDEPGSADLSVDVDFTALKHVAEKDARIDVHGPVEQGDWLHALGIGARATVLANSQKDDIAKNRVAQAYHRLVERSGGAMGKIYKVMAFTPPQSPTPVGFGGSVAGEDADE